jgi:hypothetical protein
MFDDDCFVNFSNQNDDTINIKSKKYINYDKFDNTTSETYRVMRELHIDPITHEKVPENLAFKFEYMWDPITGDRLEKDPNGSLYFNCINLYINFYYNRLRMLWTDGDVVDNIQYEGYYGDGLCSGDDLYVPSRGISKHLHLFRLPIIDCYLEKDFDLSVITMGPKINDDEINLIHDKIDIYMKKNKTKKYKKIYDLKKIRDLYNTAISKTTDYKDAQKAVDELKKIKL